ncbi:MAG: CvpA family protein [Xanthobacteraceae bacterium]|nr:CvpA family protein [Xanthobacteraceae bacterium]
MNQFDAAIGVLAMIALVAGFRSGMLRSMATILGYVAATPIAVWATSFISPAVAGQFNAFSTQNSFIFFAVFLTAGIALGALLRSAVDETIGIERSLPDRIAGAALGVARIGLVAMTIVLVVDRIIPAGHDPAFLTGSRLRPMLSEAGQRGLKSLPPDVTAYIDRLKRDQRI